MKKYLIEDAIKDLNNQLDVFYEGKRFVNHYQVSSTEYALIYEVGQNDYIFAVGSNLRAMAGYIQALANIINLGGKLGLEQVEKLFCNSKQNIRG